MELSICGVVDESLGHVHTFYLIHICASHVLFLNLTIYYF